MVGGNVGQVGHWACNTLGGNPVDINESGCGVTEAWTESLVPPKRWDKNTEKPSLKNEIQVYAVDVLSIAFFLLGCTGGQTGTNASLKDI